MRPTSVARRAKPTSAAGGGISAVGFGAAVEIFKEPTSAENFGYRKRASKCAAFVRKNPKVVGDASLCSLFRRYAPYKSRLRNQKRFHSRYNFGYGILLYIRKTPHFCPLPLVSVVLRAFFLVLTINPPSSAVLRQKWRICIVQGFNRSRNDSAR